MVICLERGADLHIAQLMPLPLTVSCFSKIQIGFTFLVPAHPGSPGQRAVKRMYVCMLMADVNVLVGPCYPALLSCIYADVHTVVLLGYEITMMIILFFHVCKLHRNEPFLASDVHWHDQARWVDPDGPSGRLRGLGNVPSSNIDAVTPLVTIRYDMKWYFNLRIKNRHKSA